jgi:alginate O-acetyltransferase complex protein AlgI
MIFPSVEFILVFLPITALLFALMHRYANVRAVLGVLTVASIVFYAAGLWHDKKLMTEFVSLLVGSIIVNWCLSLLIDPGKPLAKPALWIGVIGNIALIFWFKYFAFVSTIAADAHLIDHPLASKILPLGISFFTFVQIAYLIDRYKGLAPHANLGRYLLFVSFFPHLIAGPIVHHASMMPQLEHPRPTLHTFSLALFIFAVGFAKKTLIADPLGSAADAGFDPMAVHSLATLNAWAVVICYTMQLYFDFSGYSDMAVGLALMFGVQFPWNFLSPYKSTSISQFWRNWHITLSNFLREYVYIPLGGSRVSKTRHAGNLLATMLIGGIWHGAGWTFILWGGLHGMALVINHRWTAAKLVMPAILGWAITTLTVIAGWVLFRAKTFGDAALIYKSMLGHSSAGRAVFDGNIVSALPYLLLAIVIAIALPNTKQLSEKFRPSLAWALGTGALMGLSMMFILGKVAPPEFLYYQF